MSKQPLKHDALSAPGFFAVDCKVWPERIEASLVFCDREPGIVRLSLPKEADAETYLAEIPRGLSKVHTEVTLCRLNGGFKVQTSP